MRVPLIDFMATPMVFFFKMLCWRGMGEMAYLTEHLSRQERSATLNNKASAAFASPPPPGEAAPVQAATNEHRNLDIARRLNEERGKLINALSQFPVTALLLLNDNEKLAGNLDIDEESVLVSDLAAALADIKRLYQAAKDAMAEQGQQSAAYIGHKENLALALQAFPYCFDTLKKIVEAIVYAYKLRGLGHLPAHQGNDNDAPLLLKRLEGDSRHNRGNVSKMAHLFRSMDIDGYDRQFLFLSVTEMRRFFVDMVVAERAWLAARQQLAGANNKLVLFIANQYKASFLDFEDLVQEGQSGLLKAVDRFDYRLGFQFSTYAGYWIRQAISRSLSRCERLVRVPCGQVAAINKVFRAKNELMARTGMEPSVNELAEHTKLSRDDLDAILAMSQTVLSLEGPEDEEDAFAPIDFLEQQVFTPAFSSMAEADLERLLAKAIGSLSPREAKVVCSHFGVDVDKEMTLQEIGAELRLTRERVRQIQVIALNKIKLNFGQQLMCFL